MPSHYEITVRYAQSEWEEFNPTYNLPATVERTYEPPKGTQVKSDFHNETTTVSEQKSTTRRTLQPKTVVYECERYRIENGCLVMEDRRSGLSGYMVPLNVIQEIRIDSLRVKSASEIEAMVNG